MRKITLYCCLLLLIVSCGRTALAQDAPKASETPASPAHYYHVDFVVQELGSDGKPVNSRSYTTTVNTGSRESVHVRASSRIPVLTGVSQYQYVDVGINIDAGDAHEIGRQLALNLTADVSSMAAMADPSPHQPVERHNKWQAAVLIPVGKATVVFASDALESKGSMQVVVTATPMQ